ncbi:MAG: phosphatase PAP2 family protein [Candidatus Saccharimonadales bacterium]
MDNLIVFGAKYLILLPIAVAVYVAYTIKDKKIRRQFTLTLLVAGLTSYLAAQLIKAQVASPRPYISEGTTPLFYPSNDYGFPSDHTLLAAFLAFCILPYRRRLGAVLAVAAILIGWVRVASGVHYFVDVVAGFVLAGTVCWVAHYMISCRLSAENTT